MRAKKVIVIEYKSHQVKNGSHRTLHREVQRGHADTWQTLQQDARTWPGGNQWAWLPAAKNLNELCLSLTRLVRRGGARARGALRGRSEGHRAGPAGLLRN